MNIVGKLISAFIALVLMAAVGLGASAATRNTIDADLRAGCADPGAPNDRLLRVKDRMYRCEFVRDATDADRK